MGENKQVRVDNWGIFFLQRLQLFFSKTDYCDLTLQFQGNVQLKVHRLVLHACTEYFELLEHSDRLIDDNVILMPEMLQADVVVPIINFMYTGMLEYPTGMYQKLHQAADLMRMSVLTKLLDAQKQPGPTNSDNKHKVKSSRPTYNSVSSPVASQFKKLPAKNNFSELPPTLPGRKLPVWKRKTIPHASSLSGFSCSEPKRRSEPLAMEDVAKPTRFEWPEDDLELPAFDMMDMSEFGDISYTSKPLLREDEVKTIISNSEVNKSQRVKEEVHEMSVEDKTDHGDTNRTAAEKRKLSSADPQVEKLPKKIKITETETDTTISVISSGNSMDFDPTKIVSEILKKYPHLVKKKKNIKLKILSKPMEKDGTDVESPEKVSPKKVVSQEDTPTASLKTSKENTWCCKECTENNGKPVEFILYYLYRKHLTDVHNVKFDPRICKYCGIAFAEGDLQSFHLFTKHGIKPSGNQVFPSCSQCPYVALSKQALQVHKSKHKKTEMQCSECKLAFTSSQTISNHIQITGHMGKTKRTTYDCQYCIKTSQSAISLLSHIKSDHEAEGRRDGIVSLDEIDLEESVNLTENDHVEEGDADGEYIVPEMRSPVNKVKIISDVKVPAAKNVNTTEVVTVDQSKVQSSVPTSIATSIGLLDIVVLDENQQFILQNQEEPSEGNQTEYILPQIGSRNVRADGLGSSPDELVMVLTDQDYKDGRSAISTENSNIVVLYSHPADGQQGQFITSQGNLMVNSETGLLEIRNGATIATTSANQIVMRDSHSSHMETIEMIQREIDETQTMKQEPFYEEERKPQVPTVIEEPVEYEENIHIGDKNQQEEGNEVPESFEGHVEKVTEGEGSAAEVSSSELRLMDETEVESSVGAKEGDSSIEENEPSEKNVVENTVHNIQEEAAGDVEKDNVPNVEQNALVGIVESAVNTVEEVAVDDVEQESEKSIELDDSAQNISESKDTSITENEQIETEKTSTENQCPENMDSTEIMEEALNNAENNDNVGTEQMLQEEQSTIVETEETSMEIENEKHTKDSEEEESKEETPQGDEQPDKICPQENIAPDDSSQPGFDNKDAEKPYSPTDNPIDMQCEIESNADTNERQDAESVNENENSFEVSHGEKEDDNESRIPCEKEPNSQENDENSQSSQESSQALNADDTREEVVKSPKESTKISILDDWEDTDSQHSDNKTKSVKKGAEETVHKLMDDWEEEDVEK